MADRVVGVRDRIARRINSGQAAIQQIVGESRAPGPVNCVGAVADCVVAERDRRIVGGRASGQPGNCVVLEYGLYAASVQDGCLAARGIVGKRRDPPHGIGVLDDPSRRVVRVRVAAALGVQHRRSPPCGTVHARRAIA